MADQPRQPSGPPGGIRRWPASVYGSGSEPDPRFTLANERTFLAWIRTTLALLAAGAALAALDLSVPDPMTKLAAPLLALTGFVCAVQAWRGWMRTERALRHARPLPSSGVGAPVALVVALLAVALLAGSLV